MKTRSGTVNRLHITEAAYIKDYAELVAGSKQAVPKEGRISEESTANGYNVFYDLYTSSKSNQELGEYAYKTYFYGWHENAEYTLDGAIENKTDAEVELQQAHNLTDGQLLWRRWKVSELAAEGSSNGLTGEQLFKQEYPTTDLEAFQNASGSVFDQEQVAAVIPKKPIQNTNNTELQALIDKRVQVWIKPQKKQNKIDEQTKKIQAVPAHEYVIGVDPSGGESADYAAISVWDCDTLEQVAQWHGKEHPQYVAELAAALGRQYNNAYIGVENNMLSTILYLVDTYDNANIYYDVKLDQLTKKRKKTYGFNTNAKTRPVIIDNFVLLFSQGDLAINSTITLSEMQTFIITDTGKREHAPGKHDDALFSDMIALQIMKHRQQKIKAYTSKPQGF